MTLPKLFRDLARGRRGNVLVLGGLAMPVLIGFAGLATDTITWTLDKRQLQRSADSAALSGAFAKAQSHNAVSSATADITRTNSLTLVGTPTIQTPPTAGSYSGNANAVRVVLQTQRAMPFSGLFLQQAPLITVSSTAAIITNGNFCVISLDKGTTTGVTATGSAVVDLNCGIFANSKGSAAVSAGGAATVRSTPVAAVGAVPASSAYVSPTTLQPYSLPQPDPFGNLPQPNPGTCANPVKVNPQNSVTLSPGCYRGIDIAGTANFQPGIYYIDGGSLSFGAQAIATGSDVTFILTSKTAATNPSSIATLDMNGGAQINLTSPTTGTYAGVLVYQDPRAIPSNQSNKVNGNSGSKLQGAFYFPKQDLDFNGNAGISTDCVQFVAYRVTFSGNSTISNVCPTGPSASFRGAVVRLVE